MQSYARSMLTAAAEALATASAKPDVAGFA